MVRKTTQTPEEKFESWRDALAERMHNAHGHLEALIQIDEFRVTHVNELNIAPAFWGITLRAHLHAGILNLTTLLSKNLRVTSLPRLLDHMNDHLGMFSNDAYENRLRKLGRLSEGVLDWDISEHSEVTTTAIEERKQALLSHTTTITHLKAWRDKVLAHIDSSFLERAEIISKVYPLHKSDLIKLVATLDDIFNYCSNAYDGSGYKFGIPFQPGLNGMISILEQRNKARYQ